MSAKVKYFADRREVLANGSSKLWLVDQHRARSILFQQHSDLGTSLIPSIVPKLDHLGIIVEYPQSPRDFFHVLRGAMESGRILQEERPQFSALYQGLHAGAELIYILLRCRLPLIFRTLSPNFHRVRKLLPQFYGKTKVGWSLVDPTLSHCPRWRPVKSKIDFDRVEDLRVIFELIEAFPLRFGIKGTKPALRRPTRIG